MKASEKAARVARQAVERLAGARAGVEGLAAQVGNVRMNPNLSDVGKREEVSRLVGEAGRAVRGEFDSARLTLEAALAEADRALAESRDVPAEVLSVRAAVLSPILNAGLERPEALLNAYRARFDDLADRRLLEESAGAVIDALGSDGAGFAERWRAAEEELSSRRPPEERQALADRAELEQLADYFAHASAVVGADLEILENESLSDERRVARQMSLAAVNEYESRHIGAASGAE